MGKNSVLKEFSRYSSLNVLGMLGISFYILADTFFVANGIGSDALAALNIALPVYSLVHGTALLLGMGGGTKFSIYKSQGEYKKANSIFSQTILTVIAFAIVYMLVGLLFSGNLSVLLGADDVTFDMTNIYLKIVLLFSPAFILNETMICFIRNDGSPHLSTAGMIVGSLFNIVFDYIFIYNFKLGMLGAVLATGFSPVVSLIILSTHFLRRKNSFKFIKTKIKFKSVISIFSIGLPSLVTELSSGIVIIIFNIIMLKLCGNLGVAAYGVIANIALVILAIFNGIAQGAQPIISHNYGKQNNKNMLLAFKYAALTAVLLALVLYIIMFIFSSEITLIFNNEHNEKLQQLATTGIKLYFIGCVFAGFNIISSAFFSSVENAKTANTISLLRGFIVIIPSAIILSVLFSINGLWLSFTVCESIVSIISIIFLIKNIAKKTV